MKVVLDQVREWFSVVEGADLERVSKAWWVQKQKFHRSPKPWSTVKGPMGATIATLKEVDWLGVTPFQWIGHDGFEWAYNPSIAHHPTHGNFHPMMDSLRAAVERKVWSQASFHHCGRGLAQGADIYGLSRHLKQVRSSSPKDASLMLTIAAAGAWSEARKHDAGMVESPLCPRCGVHEQDDLHMHWTCPALMESKDSRVQKSNYLVYKAEWGASFHPCFWLRGIVPKNRTHRPMNDNQSVRRIAGDVDRLLREFSL